MESILKNKVLYFTFPKLSKYNFVKHAFSSRIGGISEKPYLSMNLGLNTEDSMENVRNNYKRFCDCLNIDYDKLVISSQTHGTVIRDVTENDIGKGLNRERDYTSVDGLITNIRGIPLIAVFADCVPLFFLDPVKKIIGLAHSGWKGTADKIGEFMVRRFVEKYKSNSADVLVGIGPSIGPCCYEVSDDICTRFSELYCIDESECIKINEDGKKLLNLWEINRQILISAGIRKENIVMSNICTKCRMDIFFSYRGENGKCGRLAAVIQLT